ncbi:NAD-dependent epimerase/dehydratase family protein [Pseudomonas sp. NFR16]|uniref:NAD-dependent epimerase/dehydratase family protein n=1 Tax=Pseudomonas sp. NFR16 TaxID=1566248 RepID=UPI0008B3A413|nr:NAD-dependent epimerase/dehydratase family protein [Pseudomonas sp. NFR16]SEJ94196.1 Nucleoside-diphosphate-sugar epimerase [Pseudomonas sp. NFR16]
MRILVTGASGFIGTRLCQLLMDQSQDVTGICRSGKGSVVGVKYIATDFTDPQAISGMLNGIDCVVHLAGRAHVLDKQGDSADLYQAVNCDATLQLAREALSAGVRRFVFISSIGVNGNESGTQRFSETSTPHPVADYARSKLEAEIGLRQLLDGATMEWVIIRPPLVYGANAPGNFRTLLKVVEKGIPSPFALVRNARSIISVDNLATLIALACQHPDAAGQTFLASDGSDVSTHQMLGALAQGMGKRVFALPVPGALLAVMLKAAGKGDLYTQLCGSLTVDCSRARQVLGYQPDTDTLRALMQVGREYRLGRQGNR